MRAEREAIHLTRRGLISGAVSAFAIPGIAFAQPLRRTLAEIERRSGGRLGVAVLDTGTGKHTAWRGDERFPLCSTSKVLECAALLARVDAGQENLNRRIHFPASALQKYSPITRQYAGARGMTLGQIGEAAITLSDNTAANLIIAELGGPAAITSFARSIGDTHTRLDRTEPNLNQATPGDPRDTTTPNAMAADLRALLLGQALSAQSRHQLTGWMLACQTGYAKLRAGVPPGWRVADKTGSGGFGTTNDIAVLWPLHRAPLVVCAYFTQTTALPAACDALFASIARAVAIL